MKKYISYLLTLALLVPALISCTQERDFFSKKKTHTVYFSTADAATRTGLAIDEESNLVKPFWNETDVNNIHFFEFDANNVAAYGGAKEITLSEDDHTARFTALISEEIIINADPSTGDNGSKEASARVAPFTYAAVVAQQPDPNAYTYEIPAEQHPNAETLKDPDAEFLVGYSRKAYDAQYNFGDLFVSLYFDRVAALGRLAISGFKGTGEMVKSVTITTKEGLTGKATYPGDFTFGNENKVKFTRVADPLVLNYGETGFSVPTGENANPFYAYFVAVPDKAYVTSIEVLTDQYKYTKTNEEGAEFTFSDSQLLNINFDLSDVTAEPVSSGKVYRKVTAETDLEVGAQYLLVYESTPSVFKPIENDDYFVAGDDNVENVTISEGKITSNDLVDYEITLEEDSNKYYLYVASHQRYLAFSSHGLLRIENKTMTSSGQTYDYAVSISISEGIATLSRKSSDGTEYRFVYSSNKYFEALSATANVCLYKYDDGRTPQTLSFSEPGPFDYDLDEGGDFEEPTLTSASGTIYGEVTYKSSDESIATVASDGEVTFQNKTGDVVITATAAGDDANKPASASYTIRVKSSNLPTFFRVKAVEIGEKYLIVSNGVALDNDGTSTAAAVEVEISEGIIQYKATDSMLWTVTEDPDDANTFRFENGSKILRRSSSSAQIGSASSTKSNNQWIINEVGYPLVATSYYLYYSESQSGWKVSNSASDTHTAMLFSSKQPRNLVFSSETVTHDLATQGTDVAEPTLTGASDAALVGVTYAVTEGTDVASVNATTGEITLKNVTGSAVITASATKTDDFTAESVSYTLIVKDSNIPTKRYVLASEIVAGKKYLIVSNSQALKNNSGNVDSQSVTPTAGVVEIESGMETLLEWTATAYEGIMTGDDNNAIVAGHFSFANGGYRLSRYSKTGTFRPELIATSTDMNKYGVWDLQNYNGVYYLFHDSSSTMRFWLSYNSEWKLPYLSNSSDRTNPTSSNVTNGPVNATQLYVEEGGDTPPTPEEQDQNLSFPEASYTAQMGTAFTAPVLSGAQTTVTYSSSKESVATVNTSTGAVTLVGPGKTTITANAPAGTVDGISYKAGSAQYTLTVEDTSPSSNKTFTKVSAFTSGKKYIIVDGTNALMNNSGEDALYSVFGKISGNTLTVSSSEVDAIEWTVVSNAAHTTQGDFTIKNGEYYLTRANTTNENNDVTLSESVTAYTVWTLDGSNLRQKNSSGQYTFYLHVVNSNRWTANTQTAPNNITIYEESAGGDPTPTTTSYSRVSFATGITTGKYLIVNPADAQVFTTVTSYPNSASVTPSNGVISGDYASYEVTITKSGDNYTIQNANGQYLYYVYTSGDTQTRVAYKSDTENWAASSVSSDANGFDLNCSGGNGRQHIYWNDSTAGAFFKIGSQSTGVHLYKKADNL